MKKKKKKKTQNKWKSMKLLCPSLSRQMIGWIQKIPKLIRALDWPLIGWRWLHKSSFGYITLLFPLLTLNYTSPSCNLSTSNYTIFYFLFESYLTECSDQLSCNLTNFRSQCVAVAYLCMWCVCDAFNLREKWWTV